jgi:hypothetical protein
MKTERDADPAEEFAKGMCAGIPLLPNDLRRLDRWRLGGLPVGEQLGDR